MRYYIIAGEASGDLHGSNLMKGLFEKDPDAEIRFWGGDAMASVGGTMVRHYKESAVMGLVEVVMKLGRIFDNIACCKRDILQYNPDVLILIDYPGFNMRMASFARRNGIKVFYYIAPKVWARGENRIRKMKRYVDELFIIFPFETEYFKKKGIDAHYFGNPLIDSIDGAEYEDVDGGGKTVALLAGSREAELKWLMPRFVELERLVKTDRRFDGYKFLIAGAPSMTQADYDKYLPEETSLKVVFGKTYSILKQADAAVVSSGTASLETALVGTPQVVCYGFNRITYALARLVVHVRYISLANLILDKLIFKELIQDDSSSEMIFDELKRLVFDDEYRIRMAEDYARLRTVLGGGGASSRVAGEMVRILSEK